MWRHFASYIEEESPKLSKSMLVLFNKGVRDENERLVLFALASLFELLDVFVQTHNACAPLLYKTLIFLLIESHSNKLTREFILVNLMVALRKMPYAPVDILIVPFVKQISLYGFDNYDIDFAILLSRHQNLSLSNGGFALFDLCGKICLRDATFGRSSSYAFIYLIDRFVETSPKVHKYTLEFSSAAVATLLSEDAPRDLKMSIVAILTNIVQLKHESLNQTLAAGFESARITRPLFDLCVDTKNQQLLSRSSWPEIDENPDLDDIVLRINSAIVKSARPLDCWPELFSQCGVSCNTTLIFEALQHVLRSPFPGLELALQELENSRLELLWRTLDPDCVGQVAVNSFFTFMSIYAKRQVSILSKIEPSPQAVERKKAAEHLKAKSPPKAPSKSRFRRFDASRSKQKSLEEEELSMSIDHRIITCKKKLSKGFAMLDEHNRYILSKLDLLAALKDSASPFHRLIISCPCSKILLKAEIVDELRRLRTRDAGYITQVELVEFVVFHVKAERIKEKRKGRGLDDGNAGVGPAKLKVQRDIRTAKSRFEAKAREAEQEEERRKLKSRERRRRMRRLFEKIKGKRWVTLTSGSSLDKAAQHRNLPCAVHLLKEYLEAFQSYVHVLQGVFIKYTKAVIPNGSSFDEIDDGQTAMALAGWLRLARFFQLLPGLFNQHEASSFYHRALAYGSSSRKMQIREFFIALSLIAHSCPRFRYHEEACGRIRGVVDFLRTSLQRQVCVSDEFGVEGRYLAFQWSQLQEVPCYKKSVPESFVTTQNLSQDKAAAIR